MRQRAVSEAESIGVTADFLSHMVDEFYLRIRQDEVLGPIFNKAIGQNWPSHMETMKKFWSSVELMAGTYSGKPMVAHAQVDGLEKGMFSRWLQLFEHTLDDIAPTKAAHERILARAKRIAQSLELGLFYRPD